ncbi:DUF2061 domain-containing protein [Pyruvatibacter mobilis]|uniref:DUF2061 domain-containing protein n=1 Tax=Pyruvatibacter mobilis TaxID=1712261 RepID=UPI003D11B91E
MSRVVSVAGSRAARKTFTYSVMHMAVAIAVAFVLSGSWVVAFSIGLIEPLVQTVAYHLHERAWGHDDGSGEGRSREMSDSPASPLAA